MWMKVAGRGNPLEKKAEGNNYLFAALSQQFFANFLNKIIEDETHKLGSALKKDVSNFKLYFVPWENVANISTKLKYKKSICWMKKKHTIFFILIA